MKKASFPLRYRLDITYADGTTVEEHDAYEFRRPSAARPNLLGEGRTSTIDQLGAHVTEIDASPATGSRCGPAPARSA